MFFYSFRLLNFCVENNRVWGLEVKKKEEVFIFIWQLCYYNSFFLI